MKEEMKDKRKFINTATLLLVLTGIIVILYAPVSKYLAKRNQIKVTLTYEGEVAELEQEQLREEWRKAEEYNDILAGRQTGESLLPGSGRAVPENYYEVLNVGGVMGVIRIPVIDLQLPIYHGTGDAALRKGAGHIPKTALPIGGTGNHTVLTGHRGLTTAELFSNLDQLVTGDIFYIDVLGKTLVYQVDQILVAEPEDLSALKPVSGKDYVTLITCTPYAVNTHRILVRGERIEYVQTEQEAERWFPADCFCIVLILLFVLLLLLLLRRRAGEHVNISDKK